MVRGVSRHSTRGKIKLTNVSHLASGGETTVTFVVSFDWRRNGSDIRALSACRRNE